MTRVLSALPIHVDLEVARDADAPIKATLQDETGAGVDITSDTIALVVKVAVGGSTAFTVTNAPGQHSAPSAGETVLLATKANLAGASTTRPTRYVYEIRRTTGGLELPWWYGSFTVIPTR